MFDWDRGDVRERGDAETDSSGTTADGTTAGLKTKTKTEETVFAQVAFFGAEGSAPCARVRPMLASVVAEYDRDRVRLVEMDIETDADTADALGVAGTPTALFYRVRGAPRGRRRRRKRK